ncbi:MAG: hypothetical protein Q4P84_03615 [Elusimicrobiales bacterium]|nr:hypothetical protein [Elusimicrobiales bacterium]
MEESIPSARRFKPSYEEEAETEDKVLIGVSLSKIWSVLNAP